MSEPVGPTDGHPCGEDCTDDEPVVVGRWLRFLTMDHDGLVWVPIANITRIESGHKYLDVAHIAPDHGEADEASNDVTTAWDRINCPAPWRTAADIARAPP